MCVCVCVCVCGYGCLCCVCNLQWRMCMDGACVCVAFDTENSILGPLYLHMCSSFGHTSYVALFCLLSFVLSVCLPLRLSPTGGRVIKDVELSFWKAMGGHRAEPHTHIYAHMTCTAALYDNALPIHPPSLSLLLKKISQW